MDLKRKLELMKKYDFQDFGNIRGSIEFDMAILRWGCNPEKAETTLSGIEESLKQMQQQYGCINFTEILAEIGDEDKEDFATLFRTREVLPKLHTAVQNFVAFVKNKNYKVSAEDETYRKLDDTLTEIKDADSHQGCRYRARIRSLENHLNKSEPARAI